GAAMFAAFGKHRPEEEKRRRPVCDKEDSKRYADRRGRERPSNSRCRISPGYPTIGAAEGFVRLPPGNPDIRTVGIRQAREVNGKAVRKPVETVLKGGKNANGNNKTDGKTDACRQTRGEGINAAGTRRQTRRDGQKR
ncbi:TPA: hypothetical protein ACKLZF_001771, partial [Neisseria gonorrhoeae]